MEGPYRANVADIPRRVGLFVFSCRQSRDAYVLIHSTTAAQPLGRCRYFLIGVVSVVSLVSTTKTASSRAGSVALAFSLTPHGASYALGRLRSQSA